MSTEPSWTARIATAPGMIDDLPGVLAAVGVPDGVDTYGEVASGEDDA